MSTEAADGKPKSRWGRIVRRGIALVVLLAAATGVYFYWRNVEHDPRPTMAAEPPGPIPVSAITVQSETVPMEMRYLGQTEETQEVEVRSRVSGHLIERSFEAGERVEAGQKLFQIDPRPFEVQLSEAKAQLARAEATLAGAESDLQRARELRSREAISQDQFEEAETAQRVAAAEVALQEAQIEAIKLQLEYTSIESPIRGQVGMTLIDVGNFISTGSQEHLVTVYQLDPMYVLFFITEQDILRFQDGVNEGRIQAPALEEVQIQITLSNGSVYPHAGRINFLDVQVDPETGTSVIRGDVPNPEGKLIPGQFVYATIQGVKRVGVMRVPRDAVMMSPTGASVYVVNDENVVESRRVTLGQWSGEDEWIIESGLEPGDRVVTDRLMQVNPGTSVTIADEPAAESESESEASQVSRRQAAARDRTASP